MFKRKTPKALAEVWTWKDACFREVAHLPTREAIIKRLSDCARTGQLLGLAMPEIQNSAHRPPRVAESGTPYKTKGPRKANRRM